MLAAILCAPSVQPALAHGPDPELCCSGRLWGRDQVVGYSWQVGSTPPSWMAAAIDAGAGDVGESRGSRAALFVRTSTGAATIGYGGWSPCVTYAIACMDRSGVPTSFGVWFRPYGWAYDWGSLRWCQGMSTPTDGCYDAENLSLDELGHVEILGHHVNYSDESDFTDSVVQAYARSRSKTGWNQHWFGRCDVARLQMEYDLRTASDKVSTCLNLSASLTFAASATSLVTGDSVRFSANLRVVSDSSYMSLSGDQLSRRTISLQRRPSGSTTWSAVTTMPAGSGDGTYAVTVTPTGTADWRAAFADPSGEGLGGATSVTIRVTVTPVVICSIRSCLVP